MATNGQLRDSTADAHVLRWPGRVLSLEDVRRNLNGHHELVLPAGAVITPLAAEQLRANGITVSRQPVVVPAGLACRAWGYAQDRADPAVRSAVKSLERDGLLLRELSADGRNEPCRWARAVAECVARGDCQGGVIFSHDPGLVCCVANKVAGLRAVAVVTIAQAARATLTLGANLAVVEMPGRTFFEIRQILRTLCETGSAVCPDGVACTLRELDGHAHR